MRRRPTDHTLKGPARISHPTFGTIDMPVLQMDEVIRRVRDSVENERDEDGGPFIACEVRHMWRIASKVLDRSRERCERIPRATRTLYETVRALHEFDADRLRMVYPAMRTRTARGTTHSRDVVVQALCRLHRIAIPSPPMGIEIVSGAPPEFDNPRPHTALTGLPEGMPELRLFTWCWSGGGTNAAMRWPSGVEYVDKGGFSVISVPKTIPDTIAPLLVGKTADTIIDVPGFDRIVVSGVETREHEGRTLINGRHMQAA